MSGESVNSVRWPTAVEHIAEELEAWFKRTGGARGK
jgi:hypothetical protein